MGFGDEIMVTGQARALQQRDPRPVAVLDRNHRPRRHPLWQGNPRIARPEQVPLTDCQVIVNGSGCRPYLDYVRMARDFAAVCPGRPFTTKTRDATLPWRYTDWSCDPGELPCVKRIAKAGTIVVEPNGKPGASPNKLWGWKRWQALVDTDRNRPWVQLGPSGTRLLDGARHIETATFVDACSALSGAAAAILPEGGLHHAAAALGIPAIVIFGGMTSPANTGYGAHVNLFDADGSPCGQRLPCGHCDRAMAAISPDIVAYHLERISNG